MDEIWAFVGKKEGHKSPHEVNDTKAGDAYTFIALERSTKRVLAWHLEWRDRVDTEDSVSKARWATADTHFDVCDGFEPYIGAGPGTGPTTHRSSKSTPSQRKAGNATAPANSSPSGKKEIIIGRPDMELAGTSHVERQNGTVRQWCKRLTRLTYALSKKWENFKAVLALHFGYTTSAESTRR